MAEPVTAIDPDDENTQSLPKNAEDRKAAAALSSLNENEISQASGEAKPASQADQEALGKAMNRLEIASGQKKQVKKTEDATKEEVKKKPPVKVAADDVTLLVRCDDILPSFDASWVSCLGLG